IQDIGYAELHVFPFSRRTGTPAARLDNQVDKDIKETRVTKLIELSNQLAKQYAYSFEHDELEVIPKEKSSIDAGVLIGYTDNYLKVQIKESTDINESIDKVKLIKVGYTINNNVYVKVENELIAN